MNFSVLLPHPHSCSQLSPLMFSTHKFCSSLLRKPVLDTQILQWLLPSLSWSLTCITFSSYCSLDTNLNTDPWAPDCCPDLCCCHSDGGLGAPYGRVVSTTLSTECSPPSTTFAPGKLLLGSSPSLHSQAQLPAAPTQYGHQFCSVGFLSSSPVLSNHWDREMLLFLALPVLWETALTHALP